MSGLKIQIWMLPVIVAACALSVQAEDLDAALEAQKKKAHRRVYTDSALLQEQNLTVPQAPSEIEKTADKEFYEAEAQLNASPDPRPKPAPPAPVIVPDQNKNWLTPALMEEKEEDDGDNDKLQWADFSEKANLQNQKFTAPRASEDALIDQMVQERLQSSSEAAPLQKMPAEFKQLQQPAAPQGTLNQTGRGANATPSYMTPADIVRLSLPPGAVLREQNQKTPGLSLLAPSPAVRERSGTTGNSLQIQRPSLNPHIETATPQDPLDLFNQSTKPQSPLEQIRKSSPIHQRDPFSEDYMPEFKKSIWE